MLTQFDMYNACLSLSQMYCTTQCFRQPFHSIQCASESDAELEDVEERAHPGCSSQEHVRNIAAVQRVQASQAHLANDPAHDVLRPKLRDNRSAVQHDLAISVVSKVHVSYALDNCLAKLLVFCPALFTSSLHT